MKKRKVDEVEAEQIEIPDVPLNEGNVFDIQNLPDVPLRRILDFLSVREVRKLRRLSKGFEKRITYLRKSIFNKFYFKGFKCHVSEVNCLEISRSLSVAMTKSHAPEKLDVEFRGKMNETMIQISIGYKNIITDLGMYAYENEDLLLQPSFRFEHLESLYLNEICCNDEEKAAAFEAMLNKHSNNLNDLAVDFKFYGFGEKRQRSMIVPALPKLCSLSLTTADENAFSFVDASRPTITSLVLTDTFNWPSENPSDYELPNIQHLKLDTSSAFEFVKYNAQNLVSLELGFLHMEDNVEEDLESGTLFFPKLRELKISNWKLTPILMNCKDTLELLCTNSDFLNNYDLDDFEMPRLTDLVMGSVFYKSTIEFINSNHKTLECLWISKMPDWESKLEGCSRLDSVTKVVGCGITAQEKEKMAVMCPNAEFIIKSNENKDRIQDLIRSRCKRKKFSFDMFDRKLYSEDNKS